MAIEIDDTCIGLWFIEFGTHNWLCGVNRRPEGGHLIRYRHRYYRDDKAHGSSDDRSWYEAVTAEQDADKMVEGTDKLAEAIRVAGGDGKLSRLVREPGEPIDQFVQRLRQMPWAHTGPSISSA